MRIVLYDEVMYGYIRVVFSKIFQHILVRKNTMQEKNVFDRSQSSTETKKQGLTH